MLCGVDVMKKKIEQTIESCSQCPFKRYDSNYGMSHDSGYDCKEAGNKRIINDWEYDNSNNPDAICNEKNDYTGVIPIPDWCPLPNAT